MSILLGNYSLAGALLACALTLLASVAALRFQSDKHLVWGRWMMGLQLALLGVASACLLEAFLQNNFQVMYVSSYSEIALPRGYKIAAFWAGQEGSLLLWALLLGGVSLLGAVHQKRLGGVQGATYLAVLALVSGFFAALMLFAANPFVTSIETPVDGHGLNPLLQDPGMIAHPPVLFLGYAAYTVPFALMVASLVAGRKDSEWLAPARRWIILAWLMLGVGIILGAQWAYVELGWGGYWAWDPVENASLLPWLTGTALLHALMIQQRRGMLKGWTAALTAASFVLCIFGTYLTRSGIIQSVHGFGASMVGTFFLIFLLIFTTGSVALLLIRYRLLQSEKQITGLITREGIFLGGISILTLMTVVTLGGTIFPVLSRVFSSQEVTVGPSFYNKVVAPLGLVLLALMAIAPLAESGPDAARKLLARLWIPLAFTGACLIAVVALGLFNPWALITTAIAGLTLSAAGLDLLGTARKRCKNSGEWLMVALARVFDANRRRYGGMLVHLGMIMIAVGVTGSGLFSQKETIQLAPHGTAEVAGYHLTLHGLKETREANFSAVQADVEIRDRQGKTFHLTPQTRFYDKSEQANGEIALRTTLREDLYISLAGWEKGGQVTALQVIVSPTVMWIWIGGAVLSLGGVFCLLPRLLGSSTAQPESVTEPAAPVGKPSALVVAKPPRARKDRDSALHSNDKATPAAAPAPHPRTSRRGPSQRLENRS